jgi:hypothetical protein
MQWTSHTALGARPRLPQRPGRLAFAQDWAGRVGLRGREGPQSGCRTLSAILFLSYPNQRAPRLYGVPVKIERLSRGLTA